MLSYIFTGVLQVVHVELTEGRLPGCVLDRLFVVGGECNYLLRPVLDATGDRLCLQFQQQGWKTAEMDAWSAADIDTLLDRATVALHTVRACSLSLSLYLYLYLSLPLSPSRARGLQSDMPPP